jgi:hypothetical protein
MNDTIPAMLSPGELVIPRSAMTNGIEGITAFARSALGAPSAPKTNFATGGMVDSSSYLTAGLDMVVTELHALRYEMNKQMIKSNKILEAWDAQGLPEARVL